MPRGGKIRRYRRAEIGILISRFRERAYLLDRKNELLLSVSVADFEWSNGPEFFSH